ncbi:MAG: tetratricopeptide repeat protein [Bacteroidota bacterium]|nr:tetratricopeptide repeat protein [Bacteroidota bacterium]
MITRIFPLALFLFFFIPAFSQDQKLLDSLSVIAKKNPQDTSSIKAWLSLSEFTMNSDYKQSMDNAQNGLALAEKLQDDYWTGRCYFQLGLVCLSYNYSKESVANFANAVSRFEKTTSRYWLAKSLNGMGNGQRSMGRVKEATDSYLASKKIYEELGDKKGIAGTYNNLGIIFMAENQQEKALEYFKIARHMNLLINNQPWLAKNLSNMGNAFFNLRMYDSAEVYFKEATKVHLAVNDIDGWAGDLMNLGNVYTSKREYKKAQEQFNLALGYHRKTGKESKMAFDFYNIAGLYTATGDYETAHKYLDSSFTIGTKYNDLVMLVKIYEGYAAMYEGKEDYKNAYKYYGLYATKKDSITSSDMKNQMDQMEESLREEKLKEQNESLRQSQVLKDVDLNRSTIINYAAIGGIVLVLLLGFALFKRYQLKKKANVMLEEQNREIQSQKTIIEQKNLDISDSINYAKRIQDTLLPDLSALHAALNDSFIFFRPKNAVSGDFYWLNTSGNKTFVAVADCTGHGVPGAFMSMIGIEKFNQAILESGITTPAEILMMVNRQLKTVLKQDDLTGGMRDGMDVALISIDHEKMLLEFAGANRPIWIIRDGQLIELAPTKASLGGHTPASQEFLRHELSLNKNDCIYLFSDGYADQFGGPKGKKMMTKNFKKALLSFSNGSMASRETDIALHFDSWKGALEQVDDVCVIGMRVG